jgi:hypothetical protein
LVPITEEITQNLDKSAALTNLMHKTSKNVNNFPGRKISQEVYAHPAKMFELIDSDLVTPNTNSQASLNLDDNG